VRVRERTPEQRHSGVLDHTSARQVISAPNLGVFVHYIRRNEQLRHIWLGWI
jgi:hypothetical protein